MIRQVPKSLLPMLMVSTALTCVPAVADEALPEPDTSKWRCRLCVISGGWSGEWNFGVIHVDDPTPKFADYRGLDEDGFYLAASGDTRYLDENGKYFEFSGRRLALDSRWLDMRGGKQGKYELRFSWNEIPRYTGNGTVTPYQGVGSDTLTLPASWFDGGFGSDGQVALMRPASLESQRETGRAGVTVRPWGKWTIDANFEHQRKTGTQAFGGGTFAINSAAFPAPLDYTTRRFDVALGWASRKAQFRMQVLGSDFENGHSSVTWDNPIPIGFGDQLTRSALAPDNQFTLVALSGSIRLASWLRFSGKASTGKAEQDDPLLPYSINPAFDDRALPRQSLNGKLDTSIVNLSGRVLVRLSDGLDLTAQYRTDERDNRTPVDSWDPVLLEVFGQDPVTNRPYSYDRSRGRVELRYRASYRLRLNGGWSRQTIERTYQEVEETEEDTVWAEAQFTGVSWLDARVKFDRADRSATDFVQQGNYNRPEHPLMRKFYMAERDRDRTTLELVVMPLSQLDIGLHYYMTEDDYSQSVIGLQEGEETSLNLNLNWAASDKVNVYAYYTIDQIDSSMAGAESIDDAAWLAHTDDEIRTWGLGVSGRFSDKLSFGFDYLQSDSDGDIFTDNGEDPAPFPTLQTRLNNTRIYLAYDINDTWGVALDAYREEYDSSDWLIDGLDPFGINGTLTMGDTSPEYDVNVIRVLATLRY